MFDGGAAVARPPKATGKVTTKHVRINDDLAEMFSWVLLAVKAEGGKETAAQLLDPHIRGPITRMFNEYKEMIDTLKRAQKKAQQRRKAEPEEG